MPRGRLALALVPAVGLVGCPAEPAPRAPALHASRQAAPQPAGWLARVQRTLAAQEYEAGESAAGLQAPNRRHNLRTYFEPTGIRVVDRTAPGSPALLELRLASVGRGRPEGPASPGEVRAAAARVEIRRPGILEWYLNSPAGLEQGFTLDPRPPGEGALVLALDVGGAEARLRGEDVLLRTSTGRRLEYGKLQVLDAGGDRLPARLEVPSPDRIHLVVEDGQAPYPLILDPLLTASADSRLEPNQAFASLGEGVAGAGDVDGDGFADVIVGAPLYDAGPGDEGAAFVFLGSASGIADGDPITAHARLVSGQPASSFGASVAGAGDVNGDGFADVIVGARDYDLGQGRRGAAFVFLGSASGIADGDPTTAHARLVSGQLASSFGADVAGTGDVNGDGFADVIVGAPDYVGGQSGEGAAFVFLGSASGIAHGGPAHARLESNQVFASLGSSVAGAGDVNGDGFSDVIAGAPLYDAPQFNEGAAFVFLGSASGIVGRDPASAHAQLESNQVHSAFGGSLASAGDLNGDGYADVIVGARLYDSGQSDEGAAFVFLGSASGIADGSPASAHARLESNQENAGLGVAVACAGDVNGDGFADVIVGASLYDAGESDEGAAFVFLGSASGLPNGDPGTAHSLLQPDQADARLGESVAGAGDVNGDGFSDVVVGAPLYDAGQSDEGAAFVFLGGAPGMPDGDPISADARLRSTWGNASVGESVAGAGDVNGDGYADVIVGAPKFVYTQPFGGGAAFVFHGSASGIADGDETTADTLLEGDQELTFMGLRVAGAGDVNGDGYADVIVGAYTYDAGETGEGAAFLFLGSPDGIADGNPTTAHARIEANQEHAGLSWTVAGAGDVNGDGYADVIVGAPFYDGQQTNAGAAFVFLGSRAGIADGDPSTAHARLESDSPLSHFGTASGVGDVNGDGFADVIVGAPGYNTVEDREGAAFLFLGSPSGLADGGPGTADARLEAFVFRGGFGTSVAGAGDVNGDGFADVIIGAPSYGDGAAFLFLGSPSGLADGGPSSADASLVSEPTRTGFGVSVAGAGDVNGDGYADVIVGASRYEISEDREGAAFLFLGSPSGLADGGPATADARLEADLRDSYFGASVAGAGDVNGDGFADVLVGAHNYPGTAEFDGEAFLFLGDGGRPVLARQRRGDGSGTPVQPWGLSGSDSAFQVEITAHHPEGCGRVKAEIEACPSDLAFGDPGCTRQTTSSWLVVDAGTPEVVIQETVAGLTSGPLYRWRARVLRAPFGVTEPGVTAPPNPEHGPWRRLFAQASDAEIRLPEPHGPWLLGPGLALLALLRSGRGRRNGDGVA